MKDNYDISKMQRVPHPLAGKINLVSRLGSLTDDEFERRLNNMEPDERDIAIRLRKRRQSNASVMQQ